MDKEPQIGSLAWIENNKRKQEELHERKAARPPRIDEHVDFVQADREAMQRKRTRPTSGITTSLPIGWSSAGEDSKGNDPGK